MRGVLMTLGETERVVWVADSFNGLPKPTMAQDADDLLHTMGEFAVTEETVRANFVRYGLLDDKVRFLHGWFKETLPSAPIVQLALIRLDGDLYESTIDAISNLYDRLAVGGYVIIDDYHLESCRSAITDYRRVRRITDPIKWIDWGSVYWRKSAMSPDT